MQGKNGELELIEINQPVCMGTATYTNYQKPKTRTAGYKKVKRRKKSHTGTGLLLAGALLCLVLIGAAYKAVSGESFKAFQWLQSRIVHNEEEQEIEAFLNGQSLQGDYPKEILELVKLNEETLDFVKDYPNREKYQNQPIDLSGEIEAGQVPLLMQWDKRWGYDRYGESNIALSGCGPVCLTMAYLYFTSDTSMNPRKMAEFASENGYYTDSGTSWDLWTDGVSRLGLTGETLPLDENRMKNTLDNGGLIVCSMAPGDFTTTGHFILLTGYDENGFFVNDPNRHSTSEKQWDYETLQSQIKNLWGISR